MKWNVKHILSAGVLESSPVYSRSCPSDLVVEMLFKGGCLIVDTEVPSRMSVIVSAYAQFDVGILVLCASGWWKVSPKGRREKSSAGRHKGERAIWAAHKKWPLPHPDLYAFPLCTVEKHFIVLGFQWTAALLEGRSAFKCDVSPFRIRTSFLRCGGIPGSWLERSWPATLRKKQTTTELHLDSPRGSIQQRGWRRKKSNRHITQESQWGDVIGEVTSLEEVQHRKITSLLWPSTSRNVGCSLMGTRNQEVIHTAGHSLDQATF